jgi:hypothetical protein
MQSWPLLIALPVSLHTLSNLAFMARGSIEYDFAFLKYLISLFPFLVMDSNCNRYTTHRRIISACMFKLCQTVAAISRTSKALGMARISKLLHNFLSVILGTKIVFILVCFTSYVLSRNGNRDKLAARAIQLQNLILDLCAVPGTA